MAVRIQVVTRGFDAAQRALLGRIARLRGVAPRRALERVGKAVVREMRRNIAQGGNYQQDFAPLTARYAKAKRKKWGFTKPILVASKSMRDSLTCAVYYVGRATKTRLDIGVRGRDYRGTPNIEKALAHRDGNPGKKLPARDFTKLPKGFLTEQLRDALARELK